MARSIESQKRPCSNAVFCLTFHVIEGLNARGQIALYAFQSFLVEVQTNADYTRTHAAHA